MDKSKTFRKDRRSSVLLDCEKVVCWYHFYGFKLSETFDVNFTELLMRDVMFT